MFLTRHTGGLLVLGKSSKQAKLCQGSEEAIRLMARKGQAFLCLCSYTAPTVLAEADQASILQFRLKSGAY